MIDLAAIEDARRRIAPHIRKTPTLRYGQLKSADTSGLDVTLKLELLQAAGSFKARGAMNRLLTLSDTERARGIVTASGGNHGLAIARSAQVLGTSATIFLPLNAAPDKITKLRQWGAAVEIVGDIWDDANAAALGHAERTGATYAHPFSDPAVVAGQGTLGLDILDDMPEVDVILVAIGGGGLITGLSTAVKAKRPATRIIGIEPIGSPTLHACLQAGKLVALESLSTRVATMSCRLTDQAIFETVQRNVDDIVLVSDEEMERAARSLWFEFGIAADLSGAAAVAVLQSARVNLSPGMRVCALVCGAGTDGIGPG
ncbi:Threonine dehydratase [Hyphomicrobiales bacterium]|nr:Threonine dehydratase [Hyphomicrobiales bacterium]CAH1697885.1 Threonine dehydratase [Hyphomicrobiales bacterium]CAI0347531.1 threonine dehydratase [Hyphomicrobiales bacterium]